VRASGHGWDARLPNALAAVEARETEDVTAYVVRRPGSSRRTRVTMTATSESDPSRWATASCDVDVDDTR
jgi:hypothetical protein